MADAVQGPRAEYEARLRDRREQAARFERTHVRLGNMRLGVAAVAAVLLWLVFGTAVLGPSWLAAPAAAFAALVIWHDRTLQRLERARRAAAFYERGLARLDDRWQGHGETGDAFLDPEHPYAADLDVFGRGSLFELLSGARLRAGERTLARWLLVPATATELEARHAAIRELRERLDLREDLAVLGDRAGVGVHPELLLAWGMEPPIIAAVWPRIAARLLAGLACVTAVVWAAWGVALPFVLVAAAELTFSAVFRARVRRIIHEVESPGRDLALLAAVLARFEREPFTSDRLATLRDRLSIGGHTPSARVRALQRLIDLLNSRSNQFFAPIAAVLLWGANVAFAVERWRHESGPHLGEWLDAIGQFEALCSLAAYAYEHPDDPFPELTREGPLYDGEALAHPLLPAARAVPNDVHLGKDVRMLLVSGSNMSGKSTLLRTVGVNAVLALAGAPVRARRLRLSPLAIGATLRVQDSLQAGQSRFYAEITRVRAVVGLTAGPVPVLFLLDELLSGTNSHDRQLGAEAIVRGLLDRGAIGLVTTHDLALSAIADALAPRAANVHFADELEEGTLRFDYRMRPGVVRTSNALALMEAVGLRVFDNEQ